MRFCEKRNSGVKSIRLLHLLAAACAILLADISCGRRPSAEKPAAPVKVSLALGRESLVGLAAVAAEKNCYSPEGVSTAIRYYPSGKLALDALLKGEAEVATVAQTPVMFESLKRPDIRILAVIGSADNELKLIARKDRGIKTAADLRGKRIATQSISSLHFFLHIFLLKQGLTDKDVELLFHKPDEIPALLAEGDADAATVREPMLTEARKLLGENAVVFENPGLYVKYYLLVSTQRFLEEKPDAAKRLLRALARAEDIVKKEPGKARTIIAGTLGISNADMELLWPELDLCIRLPQSLLLSLEDEARWAIGKKFTDETSLPNYLRFIHLRAMDDVKPEEVSIIR